MCLADKMISPVLSITESTVKKVEATRCLVRWECRDYIGSNCEKS